LLNDLEKQLLRDLYEVHFGVADINTNAMSWATQRGVSMDDAFSAFRTVEEAGLAASSGIGSGFEITAGGILAAEADDIVPSEVAARNIEIRFRILNFLEGQKGRSFIEWDAPASEPGVGNVDFGRNVGVLQEEALVESPQNGEIAITRDGLECVQRERQRRVLAGALSRASDDEKNLTMRTLKLRILRVLVDQPQRHHHRNNIIGKPYAPGELESFLKRALDDAERVRAGRALHELERAGLVQPTYRDLSQPEQWLEITTAGRRALERGALDELDEVLFALDRSFVELREGAWAALESEQPDSFRQAAHSGRELIEQVLHKVAPDDEMRAEPGFKPNPEAKSGITRSMRLKYGQRVGRIRSSESNLRVAEAAERLVIEIDNRLMALAHSREIVLKADVRDALVVAEIVLRRLLLNTVDEETGDGSLAA
jgi:DNA-binding PadR family transcriptional regulator